MAGSDGRAGRVRLRLGFSARPSGSPGGRRDPAVAGHPSRMAWRVASGASPREAAAWAVSE